MTNANIVSNIMDARLSGEVYSIPDELSGGTLANAYEFQNALIQSLQLEDAVGQVAGYKIAVNGKPQMEYFGVTEPVSGALFAQEITTTPETRSAAQFQTLCVEPEIAAILNSGITTMEENPSDEDIVSCIDSYAPAIEIIDMRGGKVTEMSLATAVSINVFNHGCVLGSERVTPDALKIEEITASLGIDGTVVGTATNSAPQHPVQVIKWLSRHLRSRGLEMSAGMVILCGTHIPIHAVPSGTSNIHIELTGLGSAELSLT